ncbi:hypothetical protein PR048_024506 [Dryococelus australis]|uniref:Uncharacterized protein n=1 Tax=Dryococelus australis TaxID=614101 RepID=A0ABQ9GNQ9_9NEOP|nr:hypothetical protein PR048_024506 [Dryococelus australis]
MEWAGGKRYITEETRRPAVSSSKIPTCINRDPFFLPHISTLELLPTYSEYYQLPLYQVERGLPLELSLLAFRMWESCRTMSLVGGFCRGSPVSPPLQSCAAPHSPLFTLIGSQDLDVESRPNLFSHSLYQRSVWLVILWPWREYEFEVRWVWYSARNARAGGTGDPRENPPTSGIVRHDGRGKEGGGDFVGNRTLFTLMGVVRLPLLDSRRGGSRMFVCGNRAGRCHSLAGFLGDLSLPSPFHSGMKGRGKRERHTGHECQSVFVGVSERAAAEPIGNLIAARSDQSDIQYLFPETRTADQGMGTLTSKEPTRYCASMEVSTTALRGVWLDTHTTRKQCRMLELPAATGAESRSCRLYVEKKQFCETDAKLRFNDSTGTLIFPLTWREMRTIVLFRVAHFNGRLSYLRTLENSGLHGELQPRSPAIWRHWPARNRNAIHQSAPGNLLITRQPSQ